MLYAKREKFTYIGTCLQIWIYILLIRFTSFSIQYVQSIASSFFLFFVILTWMCDKIKRPSSHCTKQRKHQNPFELPFECVLLSTSVLNFAQSHRFSQYVCVCVCLWVGLYVCSNIDAMTMQKFSATQN